MRARLLKSSAILHQVLQLQDFIKNVALILCACICISKENTKQSLKSVFILSWQSFWIAYELYRRHPVHPVKHLCLVFVNYLFNSQQQQVQSDLLQQTPMKSTIQLPGDCFLTSYCIFIFEYQFKRKMWLLKFLSHTRKS